MMIRYKDDPTAAGLAFTGLVLLLGALLFMTLYPKPSTGGLAARARNAEFKVQLDKASIQQRLDASLDYTRKMAWNTEAQRVTPATVQVVTSLAKKNGLQLVGVRPQKVDDAGKPNRLPFLITVAGPYPAVMAFADALRDPINKLTISSLQLTASDANTNAVTGTIGTVAYVMPPPPPVKPKESAPRA
jgi:hypothetical protein